MWIALLLGLAATNLLVAAVYWTGSFGVTLTWIPGATIVLAVSLLSLDHDHRNDAMLLNIATHIIPVLFLGVFRIGIHNYTGRQPRFERHRKHPLWSILWPLAVIVMLGTAVSLRFNTSPLIFGVVGALSAIFNVANVQDMSTTFQQNTIQITWIYVLVANLSAGLIIYTIGQLVANGQEIMASIVGNIPFVSILLLGQSTLTTSGTDVTSQHVYMLANQIWPSLAFITSCFVAQELPMVHCLGLASASTCLVIGIQFMVIMKKIT